VVTRWYLLKQILKKRPLESAVINNHTTAKYFDLGRSCRQGDPISPYLFIITIEPLLRRIKQCIHINGPKIKKQEVKLSAYADDVTLITADPESVQNAMTIMEEFKNISGLSECRVSESECRENRNLMDQTD